MLLAARSLTFLADVLPTCCGTIVRNGAVPALCERLLNIEYIDLAEQSLQVQLFSQLFECCDPELLGSLSILSGHHLTWNFAPFRDNFEGSVINFAPKSLLVIFLIKPSQS